MSIHFLTYKSVYFIQPAKAGGYSLLSSGLGVATISAKQEQWVWDGYECNACNRKHGSASQSPFLLVLTGAFCTGRFRPDLHLAGPGPLSLSLGLCMPVLLKGMSLAGKPVCIVLIY